MAFINEIGDELRKELKTSDLCAKSGIHSYISGCGFDGTFCCCRFCGKIISPLMYEIYLKSINSKKE